MHELERDEERVIELYKSIGISIRSIKDSLNLQYHIVKLKDLSEEFWEKHFNNTANRHLVVKFQEKLSEEFYEKRLKNEFFQHFYNFKHEKHTFLSLLLRYNRISTECIQRHPEVFDEEFWIKLYA